MKCLFFVFILLFGTCLGLFSQEERKIIREGNKLYDEKQYDKAELKYKKALEINPSEKQLDNNIGASQYKNNSFNDAVSSYESVISNSVDNKEKADVYYNMGNSYLQAGKYDKSIESYRNALRLDPEHDLSRYNMAVATKAKLQNSQAQSQNGGGQEGEDEGQEQENNKNEDQQNNNESNENKDEDKKQQEQEPKEPKDNEMTQEEMERFLESLQEKEKEVIDKVNKDKFRSSKRNIEKEW
ncbi:MAG: tetratricopeptide repeat protein [Bacteroidales bacterium]|nr:tetratricopeptide repeat protein [Bacteroidales bacterium]